MPNKKIKIINIKSVLPQEKPADFDSPHGGTGARGQHKPEIRNEIVFSVILFVCEIVLIAVNLSFYKALEPLLWGLSHFALLFSLLCCLIAAFIKLLKR